MWLLAEWYVFPCFLCKILMKTTWNSISSINPNESFTMNSWLQHEKSAHPPVSKRKLVQDKSSYSLGGEKSKSQQEQALQSTINPIPCLSDCRLRNFVWICLFTAFPLCMHLSCFMLKKPSQFKSLFKQIDNVIWLLGY